MQKPRLSAFLITHNEAENLDECLASLQFCDETIILDHASNDDTLEIARRHHATVHQTQDWQGFGVQKQRALAATAGTWVLSIDADERVSPQLQQQILAAIESAAPHAGYEIRRVNFFLGKEMRFGGWGSDFPLRLAQKECCEFSPDIVHERMIVHGSVGRLNGPLMHYSYRRLDDVLIKQGKYAIAGAKRRAEQGRVGGIAVAITKSLWTFVRNYFFLLGLLDGRHGFIAAVSKSQETFWKSVGMVQND